MICLLEERGIVAMLAIDGLLGCLKFGDAGTQLSLHPLELISH